MVKRIINSVKGTNTILESGMGAEGRCNYKKQEKKEKSYEKEIISSSHGSSYGMFPGGMWFLRE